MASINYAAREISVKVVYYGPGLSGKTTNLQVIHKKVPPEFKSDMVSLATETDRTLFFDFLPLDLGKIKGFATKFQLYTVPGQVYYNATRKLVLRGVDGVVFVADSSPDKIQENLESFQNLEDNLAEYGYKRENIPILIQYNKRDLPNALPVEELQKLINKYNLPWNEAVANKGIGVFDSLKLIGKIVIDYLNKKYSRQSPRSATPQAPSPQQANPGPAPRQFAQSQQFGQVNAGFSQPQMPRPAQPRAPQQAPRQYPGVSQQMPPKQTPQFPRMPQQPNMQNPSQSRQQMINRPFTPPVTNTPPKSSAADDHYIDTFEPAPQNNPVPPQASADSGYYNYGNIQLQEMDEPQFEAQNLKDQNQDPSFYSQNQQAGFSGAEPAQGQFEVSDKTDLDLEIEKYQREIEEKQRRMRQSKQSPQNHQYQAPQQQYQQPAQYQQFQQPGQQFQQRQQFQPPQQQYNQQAQQFQQPSAPRQNMQNPAFGGTQQQQPFAPSQSADENDYDVYNLEVSSYPEQNQTPARQAPVQSDDGDEDMFFTSVDTDRQKKPMRKPINPRTKQQKGFLSKFFNNRDTL